MTIPKQSTRRKELVTTAARLFREHSFDRTTVRMLASETGLKSGSLFHHFKDKEEILHAVIEDGLQRSLETVKHETEKTPQIEQKLYALIYGHLKTLLGSKKDAHIVSITEWKSLSRESRQHLIMLRDEYEQYWQKIIDSAVSEGILKGDPHLLRLFILGSLNWTIQWYKPSQNKSIEDIAKQYYQYITPRTL